MRYRPDMSTRMLAVSASVVFLLIGATGAGIFFKKMNVDIERHVPFQLGEIPADARPKFVEQWAAISPISHPPTPSIEIKTEIKITINIGCVRAKGILRTAMTQAKAYFESAR